MHLLPLKKEAIRLRNEGYSYAYISTKLGVAKSTLSLWLKGVSFTPNHYTREIITQGQKKSLTSKRVDKAFSIHTAVEYAEKNFGKMTERELFFLGIGLYIGEGSKTGNVVRIVNSDPRIIKFATHWLQTCFSLKDSNFKIRIHIYPDTDEKEALIFWKKELKFPSSAFHIPYIDRRLNKNPKKKHILPYGTAHLSVFSNGDKTLGVLLHRKILASIDRVLRL